MHAERHVLAITTASDGSATAYTPVVTGRVLAVIYAKTDFADGVDFTVTAEATAQAIYTGTNVNASAVVYPRVPVQDETGANATLDGTRLLREPVVVANDRIKCAVASGGSVKTGTITLVIG
jgi:hypothetical protein